MVTALVSCISMASVQGSSLMHHKEQQILILPFGGGAQIEGTSEGSEILVVSPHHLALLTHYTLPKECPQISFLLRLQPLQNCIQLGVLLLSCCPISDMHFHQDSPSGDPHFLLQLLIIFNDGWVLSFCSLGSTHSCSVQDGFHCFQFEASCNLAQSVWYCIVLSFLILQPKVIFSQGTHPSVPSSI